jgi:hypothetical protein
MTHDERFIPCTREISIGDGVVYRPIRAWHSNTYAGEGTETQPHGDRSGCVRYETTPYGREGRCSPPKTVTARMYWNVANPKDTVSAFLSYPDGMGCCSEYFWEALGTRADGDIERWTGDDAEAQMEEAVRAALGDSARGNVDAVAAQQAREERPAKAAEAKKLIRKTAKKLRAGKTLEQAIMEDDEDEDPFTIN